MVVYFAKFLPQLSDHVASLNELLKKGVPWNWTSERLAAFNGLKEDLMSMSVLTYLGKYFLVSDGSHATCRYFWIEERYTNNYCKSFTTVVSQIVCIHI